MDINIIISGNLTGFSRFYATPNASDLYADGKFDFDYRNFLTFLNNGEKAYAISFAPHIVSVSLITRILDSFRRPGILVVSVLLQRGMIVDSIMNPHNKNALYQLLNELNDKFYERNYMNGMINQNAAVLMQDYYSDILSNYRQTSDNNQRRVNGNIDINIPNKRSGYIASSEIDIPLYLSSLYRRGYEGFHHIFFAPNAPQNIDETPEEVVMYRVYITNNKLTLPALVKLTDQIYRLSPNQGEIAFEQNYTYGDVLQGKAGSQIRASIVGETLEVSYRFKEEEKTINFIFEDRGNIIPLAQIAPVIQDTDGTRYNLSSDTFKFIGKEVYGKKVLKSTNPNYVIKAESATLDLQRLNDGATCHIQVESSSVLEESKEYQTASEHLGNQQSLTLTPKPVTNHPVRTVRPENSSMPPTTSTKNVSQKGTLKLSDGSGNKKEQIKGGKLNIKKVLLIAIPLFIILLYGGISWQFNYWPWEKDDQNNGLNPPIAESVHPQPDEKSDSSITKKITFTFYDAYSEKPEKLDSTSLYNWIWGDIIKLKCTLGDKVQNPNIPNLNTFYISAEENDTDIVQMVISVKDIVITDTIFKKSYESLSDKQDIRISLNVLKSEIDLCLKILDYVNQNKEISNRDWSSLKEEVEGKNKKTRNKEFIAYMLELVNGMKHSSPPESPKSTDSSKEEIQVLDRWDISSDEITKWKKTIENEPKIGKIKIGKITVSERITALEVVINCIKEGKRPSDDKLSDQQRAVIRAIFNSKYRDKENIEHSVQGELKEKTWFRRIKSLKDFKNSIYQGSKTIYDAITWPDCTKK